MCELIRRLVAVVSLARIASISSWCSWPKRPAARLGERDEPEQPGLAPHAVDQLGQPSVAQLRDQRDVEAPVGIEVVDQVARGRGGRRSRQRSPTADRAPRRDDLRNLDRRSAPRAAAGSARSRRGRSRTSRRRESRGCVRRPRTRPSRDRASPREPGWPRRRTALPTRAPNRARRASARRPPSPPRARAGPDPASSRLLDRRRCGWRSRRDLRPHPVCCTCVPQASERPVRVDCHMCNVEFYMVLVGHRAGTASMHGASIADPGLRDDARIRGVGPRHQRASSRRLLETRWGCSARPCSRWPARRPGRPSRSCSRRWSRPRRTARSCRWRSRPSACCASRSPSSG